MLLGGLEIPLWVLLGCPAAVLAYLYSIRNYGVFKKHGIPGPSPKPIVGTAAELFGDNWMTIDSALQKKYGDFVGTYEGTLPVMMVFDPDWVKEAFIKNFSVFTKRRRFTFGGTMDESIFQIGGEHWKHARKMLSPEFSSGKIKKMMPSIQCCEDVFIKILNDSKGEPVDIRKRINSLTLDVIGRTAFGLDAESQLHPDNAFTRNVCLLVNAAEANSSFQQKVKMGIVITLLLLFPDWLASPIQKIFNLGLLDSEAVSYIEHMAESVITERSKDSDGSDFVQSMANTLVDAPKGDPDTLKDEDGQLWTRKGFTKSEVIGNSLLFFFAGFTSTSDTMLFMFYELAHHQEIQQRLYEEIMKTCVTEEITIEQVNSLKHLDLCINETMRLYPAVFRFDRQASADVDIRGIHVTKGTVVTASAWVIHRDPEIFENPEDFDPDRFSPERMNERMSTSFMPFGVGNRQCIGNRLALLEMKMTFINVLKNFRIEKIASTPSRPIKLKPVLAMVPEDPIMVSFIRRD